LSFCKDCGKELLYKHADYCSHCGKAQFEESTPAVEEEEMVENEAPKTRRHQKTLKKEVRIIQTVPHKSPGTAALIAFVGAIFGFPGIGHIYVGRVGRGIAILVSGFVLFFTIWITLLGSFLSGVTGGGAPVFQIGSSFAISFALLYVGLLIWQIFNARSVAKQHNEKAQRIDMEDTEAA
jgi:uncharacterized membrane protein